MSDQTDEFLEHFGVIGMHWGHHKTRFNAGGTTRKERNRTEAAYQLEKHHGSKVKTSAIIAGKSIGLSVAAKVGSNLLGRATHSSSVAKGAAAVSNLFIAGNSISSVADIVRVSRYKE